MEKVEGRNQTPVSEFLLLGFGNDPELQPLLFLVFLMIYLATVAGNILIFVLVLTDRQLHTPMYFLLQNLACVELCFSSTILPRLLASLLTGDRTISVNSCLVQLYFFGVLSTTENVLLTAMSYDRYVAICQPLRYTALMNSQVGCLLVAASWIISFVICTIVHNFQFQLTFCDANEIDHFFCEFTSLLKLSCSDTKILQKVAFVCGALGTLGPFLLTLASYVCIVATILRIPSTTGKKKAFSTCSSHLLVVTLDYMMGINVYVVPIVNNAKVPKKIFSIFCTVMSPLAYPIIYCLRNKEVNKSLRKAFHKLVALRNGQKI
ncbi:olfactory receptor 10A5-like [Pelodiscus sinensis]|uniref:olfactory receptor 10A5-like n=1 Tax=Pelodiscus sinensis TaxID=13735 RepID=UPI003F6BDC90